jgi:O-antigen ligase
MTTLDYPSPIPAPRHGPSTPEIVILGLVMFAALVDLPRKVSIMGTSGLGMESLVASGLIWAVWFARPVLSNSVLRAVLPLVLFMIDAAGTRLWSSTGIDGTQLQVIGLAFLGMMILCARESAADPAFAAKLHKYILGASVMATAFSFHASYTAGPDGEALLMSRRPFSLYAMTVVAVALAGWRANSVKSLLVWAVVVTSAVAWTQSRTALVACLLLFPLAVALKLTKTSIAWSAVLSAAVAAAFAAAVLSYQPLYDRFFANDASLQVGSVAINASGRTKIWELVWSKVGDDWVFGHGTATSIRLVRDVYPEIGQPHNDYLRFYYDQGIVGVGLWSLFIVTFFYRAFGDLRRSIKFSPDDRKIHIAGILAFIAALISMGTDNTYVYGFVMIPLGAIMGASLGVGSRLNEMPRPVDDWDVSQTAGDAVLVSP